MIELAELFDRLQGEAVEISLVYEANGRYYQAKFNRRQRRLDIGGELNWEYWRGIIIKDTVHRKVAVVGGEVAVYVRGNAAKTDAWLCANPSTGA